MAAPGVPGVVDPQNPLINPQLPATTPPNDPVGGPPNNPPPADPAGGVPPADLLAQLFSDPSIPVLHPSPWADRFGRETIISNDATMTRARVQHSGATPERPRLHPKFYADIPPPAPAPEGWENDDAIDRYYMSEKTIKQTRFTVQSWQPGVLSRHVQFSHRGIIPAGHIQSAAGPESRFIHGNVIQMEIIKVDESSWFTFFGKERWYTPRGEPDPLLDNQDWSVDHPKVWGHLSLVLELANRMLMALCNDQHPFLHTLLFGVLDYWNSAHDMADPSIPLAPSDTTRVLLSYAFYSRFYNDAVPEVMPMQPPTATDPAQYKERLESLLKAQVYTFYTDAGSLNAQIMAWHDSMCGMNVEMLKPLMGDNITVAERCHIYTMMAKTLLHELCHALFNYRRAERDPNINKLVVDQAPPFVIEPHVDFEGAAEVGYSFEQHVFGGAGQWFNNFDSDLSRSEIPFAAYSMQWPFINVTHTYDAIPGHPHFADGTKYEVHMMSAANASALLSSAFWDNEAIPRKSDSYFHVNRHFKMETSWNSSMEMYHQLSIPTIDQDRLAADNLAGRVGEVERDMIQEWEKMEKVWPAYFTGWYMEYKRDWETTAWNAYAARKDLQIFRKAMTDLDVGTAANTAARFCSIGTGQSIMRDHYIQEMMNTPHAWIWHCVGLLMNAVLPIRPVDLPTVEKHGRKRTAHLEPSSAGVGKFSPQVINHWGDEHKVTYQRVMQSFYSDPLRWDGGLPWQPFDQFDYLDAVKRLIQLMATMKQIISQPWLDEINRVEQKIRDERVGLKSAWGDTEHSKMMASEFDFQVPEYDRKNLAWWDDAASQWTRL